MDKFFVDKEEDYIILLGHLYARAKALDPEDSAAYVEVERALVELHTQRALQGLHAARHGVRGLGLAQARGLRRAQLLPAPAARIKSDESRRKHRRRKRPEH